MESPVTMDLTAPSRSKFGTLPQEPCPLLQLILRQWRAGRWTIPVLDHVVIMDRQSSISVIPGDVTLN